MDIRLCNSKEEWDSALLAGGQPSFLQSWDWGEFQRAVGHEPVRILAGYGSAQCQLQGFSHNLGLGVSYLYAPRVGNPPLRRAGMEQGTWNKIIEYVKQQGYAFLRVEPLSELQVTSYKLQVTPTHQPRHTLILDLNKSAGELLSAMHPKTRYNIRLAERKGVAVCEEKDAEVFWRLNQETAARDQFKSHSKEYYKKMLAFDFAHQLTAEYQGQPIASNILIHSGDTMTYLHGASSQTRREAMAPYLLQWRGMELARRLGRTKYDLWGVAPEVEMGNEKREEGMIACFHNYCWDAEHKWGGITRFKVGFGGEPVLYGEAADVVLQPWKYKMYRLMYRMYELPARFRL